MKDNCEFVDYYLMNLFGVILMLVTSFLILCLFFLKWSNDDENKAEFENHKNVK